MAQQLQELVAPTKNPSSVPSTHIKWLTVSGDLTLSSGLLRSRHACTAYTYRQAYTHTHKIKINQLFIKDTYQPTCKAAFLENSLQVWECWILETPPTWIFPSEAHRCSSSSQPPHGLIPSLKLPTLPTMSSSTAQIQPTSAFSSDLAVEFWGEVACMRTLVADMGWIPGAEAWRRKQTAVRIPAAGAQRDDQISEVWPIFQVIKSLEMSKYWADKVTRNISEMTGHDRLAEPPDIRR